ncbi:HAD-IC family P-type ATPase [Candidatus Shikimatogenerans silvanidophilus]|uniref:HAD-IC family P-type ATPase n=1 Tax=Candidatus Shikimatogenerans silvanidophilus TaxID=2782547 RepID=UPI001BA777FD|nr:HAD-IC family P-type ATPase [Candidatus Shikimatogenerans silvanidophilus]
MKNCFFCKKNFLYKKYIPFCSKYCKLYFFKKFKKKENKFKFLDDKNILNHIIDYQDKKILSISFFIPSIRCISCIELLENLKKINKYILDSKVDFIKKYLHLILFKKKNIKVSKIAFFLYNLGYKPIIILNNKKLQSNNSNYSYIYKTIISFFCFGNIMLLYIPEYIGIQEDKWFLDHYLFFKKIIFFLSLPIFFFSTEYLKKSFLKLKKKIIDINFTISIGIILLFIKSCYNLYYNINFGYLDSLSGFIFFLSLSRLFQEKIHKIFFLKENYNFFSTISVICLKNGKEINTILYNVKKNDVIIIHNNEIIPFDSKLISGKAFIDNSFINGESKIIFKKIGSKIYAGAKQKGGIIKLKVIKSFNNSYLMKLWNNKFFYKKKKHNSLNNYWIRYFTIIIIIISLISGLFWFFIDKNKVLEIIISILIIFCPCALSLSYPFILGNIVFLLSKENIFLKNFSIIDKLSKVNRLVFDKTGTITLLNKYKIFFLGKKLSKKKKKYLCFLFKNSNHPLSIILYNKFKKYIKNNDENKYIIEYFIEIPGKGIKCKINNIIFKAGSDNFINIKKNIYKKKYKKKTKVFILENKKLLGYFIFENLYIKGLKNFFKKLKKYKISIISGDNDSEKENLKHFLKKKFIEKHILFNQTPYNKLKYIKKLQNKNEIVMMIGDGINDSAAIKQSEIGIILFNEINNFLPYCNILMYNKNFYKIPNILYLAKKSMFLIKINFIISFFYNIIGLYFAINGKLSPVISSILMPISSITIILFSFFSTNIIFKKIFKNK